MSPAHPDICLVPEKARLAPLLEAYEPDLCLCLGYRGLLPPEVLAIPRLGVLNGHPSMLPRWRGPFPVAWHVREGETELAMSYHPMDGAFDTGPVLAQGSRPMPTRDYDWPIFQPVFASSRRISSRKRSSGSRMATAVTRSRPGTILAQFPFRSPSWTWISRSLRPSSSGTSPRGGSHSKVSASKAR